jgi:inhibitor of KinA sporulation pathway (predicted exonuclease)
VHKNYFAIIDTEYTSWKGSLKRGWKLSWEKKEIVNIGFIKFDKYLKKKNLNEKNLFFKPLSNRPLSVYFQNLSKISQKKISSKKKMSEKDIISINYYFRGVKYIFCCGTDKNVIAENIKMFNSSLINVNFLNKIIDVKPYLAKLLDLKESKIISSNLPNIVGLKKNKLKKHDALDDAKAIFFSLKKLKIDGILQTDHLVKYCKNFKKNILKATKI